MNRKLMVFVVGLLALAALEFGLLGASASGIVGSSGHPLPPIGQRGNVVATPTNTAIFVPTNTPTPAPNPGCAISPPDSSPPCSGIAASIELTRPAPAAIPCDGIASSFLRVFLRNQDGGFVDDGTPVTFRVFNGSAAPNYTVTQGGLATTSLVIYSDAYSAQPNVVVQSGDLETAIRVRCIPNSDCLVSPPDNKPPCRTPFPCNPSPGSDINSPPCAIETPISPPTCAPGQTSPPCTPVSPPPCKPIDSQSPPCTPPTRTPFPCNPSPGADVNSPPCAIETPFSPPTCELGQTSPPCTPPTPEPTVGLPPTAGIGGEIYIGVPQLSDGKIRVPINTTASQDPFRAFNIAMRFDTSLASFNGPKLNFLSGGALESNGADVSCFTLAAPVLAGGACTIIGDGNVSTAGTLAFVLLTPADLTGCLHLSLATFGPPDNGNAVDGTYTVNADATGPQSNTYGPDVYVNTADGGPCAPSGGGTPTPVPTATSVPTSTATSSATPAADVCADVTGDGRVTGSDVAAIATHIFGRYRAQYDLNHDHHVNRRDVQIALSQLGRKC